MPAGCEETDERSGDTEQLSVYIWSQISLMDGREEGTTFTRTWIPRRCQVSQVKAVLLLLKTFKIKAKKLLLGAEHRKWDGCTDLLNLSGYIHIYTYIFSCRFGRFLELEIRWLFKSNPTRKVCRASTKNVNFQLIVFPH